MNYDRLLALMPAELRGRLEAETVYAPWLRRGQALERLWQDDVVLETVYNRLAPAERTVLDAVVRRIGCEPFDDARLERSVGAALSGAEVQAGFAGIRRKGLVFAFRKSWGELVYLLPEDAFRGGSASSTRCSAKERRRNGWTRVRLNCKPGAAGNLSSPSSTS